MSHNMIANKLNEYILNTSWTCQASRVAFLRIFRNNNELPVRAPLLCLVAIPGRKTQKIQGSRSLYNHKESYSVQRGVFLFVILVSFISVADSYQKMFWKKQNSTSFLYTRRYLMKICIYIYICKMQMCTSVTKPVSTCDYKIIIWCVLF